MEEVRTRAGIEQPLRTSTGGGVDVVDGVGCTGAGRVTSGPRAACSVLSPDAGTRRAPSAPSAATPMTAAPAIGAPRAHRLMTGQGTRRVVKITLRVR